MSKTVSQQFEDLCDREFEILCESAYDGLDRSVAEIKERMNSHGAYKSTATGQRIADQVLSLFGRVLDGFDEAYLSKWRTDGNRTFSNEDYDWLVSKITSRLAPQARDVEGIVKGYLHDQSLYFRPAWEQAGLEAGRRCTKMRRKVDLLKTQKAQAGLALISAHSSLQSTSGNTADPNQAAADRAQTRTGDPTVPASTPNADKMVRLFISHSSQDRELAECVVDLVRAALNLSSDAIRCTSVDGYRLRGGASTTEQLRREVYSSEAFIGLLSNHSIRSMYVLFELGARWGANKHLIPLLAGDIAPSDLGGPLAGLNALQCSERGQLLQLVRELAEELAVPLQNADSFNKHIEVLVVMAKPDSVEATGKLHGSEVVDTPVQLHNAVVKSLSEAARDLLLEAAKDKGGVVLRLNTAGGLRIQTNGRDLVEGQNPRSEARWDSALRDLVRRELLQDKGYKDEVFYLTHRGYEVADYLQGTE